MKNLTAIVIVVFFCGSLMALERMGAPKADLKQGRWSLGFDYSYSREDMKASGSDLIPIIGTDSVTIKDVESNRYYGNLGYGLTDRCELFVRLGVADVEEDTELAFNGNEKFAWGYGVKATIFDGENIDWGALWQMSWISTDDRYNFAGINVDADYDAWDMHIAAGPTIDMGGWSLYGGAFYYILEGDYEEKALGATFSVDIEEESEFGGYIGAALPLVENSLFLSGDVAFTGDGYAIGAGLKCRF